MKALIKIKNIQQANINYNKMLKTKKKSTKADQIIFQQYSKINQKNTKPNFFAFQFLLNIT